MSDEPLPVTLDNIRKWDADMRGDNDQARHIALYYLATNLREVVEMLFAELAKARDKALDEAVEVADHHREKWGNAGGFESQAVGARIITQAIRALKSPKPQEATMSEGVGG